MSELVVLSLAALMAGFIDAVAGGGGMIQVPALFAALPTEMPATIFGTNKVSSILGTSNAAWRYGRRLLIPWRQALPTAAAAFVSSFLGAMAVSWLAKEVVRPLVLVLMVAVVVYTLIKPDFGRIQRAPVAAAKGPWLAPAVGIALGFYDGFFGPGAGSFMIFAFVGLFGMSFLEASGAAKIVNLATNAAALCYFIPSGSVLWQLGLSMAVFNVVGATVGTRLALRHGAGLVRWIFLLVSVALVAKFGYDTLALP